MSAIHEMVEHFLDRAESHAKHVGEHKSALWYLNEARLALKHVPGTHPERHALVTRFFDIAEKIEAVAASPLRRKNDLGAFDPKVHRGEGGTSMRLPDDLDALVEFHDGFVEGLHSQPQAVADEHGVHHFSDEHPDRRRGYHVGRMLRHKAAEATAFLDQIRAKRRALERSYSSNRAEPFTTERSVRRNRGHGSKMPARFRGGRAMTYKGVCKLFAETTEPGHTSKTPQGGGYYSLWISEDGYSLYSYAQKIAEKAPSSKSGHEDPGVCYMDPRTFSRTTTRQQGAARYYLEMAGWKVRPKVLS